MQENLHNTLSSLRSIYGQETCPPDDVHPGTEAEKQMSANGVITQPYVRGIVYCAGNAVYGYPCVSPILDLKNSTDQRVVLQYASRADTLFLPNANRVYVEPNGGRVLLTNMLPGSVGTTPGAVVVSYVAIGLDGPDGSFDVYALVFASGAGYQLVPAAGHFEQDPSGYAVKVADIPDTCVTPTVGVFPLEYCACAAPKWPWNLVYTASIGLAGQCYNRNAVPPCKALADWAVAVPAASS